MLATYKGKSCASPSKGRSNRNPRILEGGRAASETRRLAEFRRWAPKIPQCKAAAQKGSSVALSTPLWGASVFSPRSGRCPSAKEDNPACERPRRRGTSKHDDACFRQIHVHHAHHILRRLGRCGLGIPRVGRNRIHLRRRGEGARRVPPDGASRVVCPRSVGTCIAAQRNRPVARHDVGPVSALLGCLEVGHNGRSRP